jgi:hypothetical protein
MRLCFFFLYSALTCSRQGITKSENEVVDMTEEVRRLDEELAQTGSVLDEEGTEYNEPTPQQQDSGQGRDWMARMGFGTTQQPTQFPAVAQSIAEKAAHYRAANGGTLQHARERVRDSMDSMLVPVSEAASEGCTERSNGKNTRESTLFSPTHQVNMPVPQTTQAKEKSTAQKLNIGMSRFAAEPKLKAERVRKPNPLLSAIGKAGFTLSSKKAMSQPPGPTEAYPSGREQQSELRREVGQTARAPQSAPPQFQFPARNDPVHSHHRSASVVTTQSTKERLEQVNDKIDLLAELFKAQQDAMATNNETMTRAVQELAKAVSDRASASHSRAGSHAPQSYKAAQDPNEPAFAATQHVGTRYHPLASIKEEAKHTPVYDQPSQPPPVSYYTSAPAPQQAKQEAATPDNNAANLLNAGYTYVPGQTPHSAIQLGMASGHHWNPYGKMVTTAEDPVVAAARNKLAQQPQSTPEFPMQQAQYGMRHPTQSPGMTEAASAAPQPRHQPPPAAAWAWRQCLQLQRNASNHILQPKRLALQIPRVTA